MIIFFTKLGGKFDLIGPLCFYTFIKNALKFGTKKFESINDTMIYLKKLIYPL